MQHHFEVDLACKYGMLEAILLNHFEYWLQLNEANNKNYYDGRYWTFNSMKAFKEIFPYVSEKKLRNALKHLQEEGLLITGNYNKSAYDRTLWYAFSDLAISILPKGQMEKNKKANQNYQKGEPIPYNNTDNNTDNIASGSSIDATTTTTTNDINIVPKEYIKKYIKAINPVASRMELEMLSTYEDEVEPELIEIAIEEAILNNVPKLNYIKAILNNCIQDNIDTAEKYKNMKALREERKNKNDGLNQQNKGNAVDRLVGSKITRL